LRDRTTFESFRSSSTDIRAASYSIMVISEAVRRIPDEWIAEFPNTPWHAIRAIGCDTSEDAAALLANCSLQSAILAGISV
jgi:hypothetical protein